MFELTSVRIQIVEGLQLDNECYASKNKKRFIGLCDARW